MAEVDVLRRIGRDLARRRHVDAYAVGAVALVLAVLSMLDGIVDDDLRWSVALAALGLLVLRVTLPEAGSSDVDAVLRSREAFEDMPLAARLRPARNVWIFAPSAINLLAASTVDQLRQQVLAKPDGVVRIVVLDPAASEAVELAARQLDSLDYPLQSLPDALARTVTLLSSMASWETVGRLEHRFAAYNPGFSLVAVDPHEKHGVVIVEFHGFHNETTGSRMHVELRHRDSDHWYQYWTDQFETLWNAARPPSPPVEA